MQSDMLYMITPAALTLRDIEEALDKDPELTSVCHYIQTGNWSQRRLPNQLCVKNKLYMIGKLIL